jgi:hypothetical protein
MARPSSEEKPLAAAAALRCFSAFFIIRRCVLHTHVGNRPATQARTAGERTKTASAVSLGFRVHLLAIDGLRFLHPQAKHRPAHAWGTNVSMRARICARLLAARFARCAPDHGRCAPDHADSVGAPLRAHLLLLAGARAVGRPRGMPTKASAHGTAAAAIARAARALRLLLPPNRGPAPSGPGSGGARRSQAHHRAGRQRARDPTFCVRSLSSPLAPLPSLLSPKPHGPYVICTKCKGTKAPRPLCDLHELPCTCKEIEDGRRGRRKADPGAGGRGCVHAPGACAAGCRS